MNEFCLINEFFKSIPLQRKDVILGIGDDAACVDLSPGKQLLVSTDTLVSGVHFLSDWAPEDIAYRAVAVNVSDMAAMAATPCWMTLALTLPNIDEAWLSAFSEGLKAALKEYHIDLIGGDTTKGPMAITITIMGEAAPDEIVRRSTAKSGDKIYVSGSLGAAALAVNVLQQNTMHQKDVDALMNKLLRPKARVDLIPLLKRYASAAIDISDGLSADLNHICEQSGLGAKLFAQKIPIASCADIDFALSGGDDYELCFTIPEHLDSAFQDALLKSGIACFCIGVMESEVGLRLVMSDGQVVDYMPKGYEHFTETRA